MKFPFSYRFIESWLRALRELWKTHLCPSFYKLKVTKFQEVIWVIQHHSYFMEELRIEVIVVSSFFKVQLTRYLLCDSFYGPPGTAMGPSPSIAIARCIPYVSHDVECTSLLDGPPSVLQLYELRRNVSHESKNMKGRGWWTWSLLWWEFTFLFHNTVLFANRHVWISQMTLLFFGSFIFIAF